MPDNRAKRLWQGRRTGVTVERTGYRPYGEEVALQQPLTLPEAKGFIGERVDGDAGLQYLNARYYDPRLGMFVQPDWWEVTEEGVGTNRYSYSFNDPVNGRDPGGHATYVESDEETERDDDYGVVEVTEDDDLGIYVRDPNVEKKKWERIGETRFWDSFINPEKGTVQGRIFRNISMDDQFEDLTESADGMAIQDVLAESLPGGLFDVKKQVAGSSSMDGYLLDGKYITLREIGNALAGYNAARLGLSFDRFQRIAGALHGATAKTQAFARVATTALTNIPFGEAPNYGEIDYQRTRSEWGYSIAPGRRQSPFSDSYGTSIVSP